MAVAQARRMDTENRFEPTSPGPFWRGRDLAAERVRRGLLQRDVADRMGVTTRRIGTIEAAWRPSVGAVERYLTVLDE